MVLNLVRHLLMIIFLVSVLHGDGYAQSAYFSTRPVWSSGPTNFTDGVALGDVDGDGDLDLVCGNGGQENAGQENTLYLNDGGMFALLPSWSSGPTSVTFAVALGDVDGDGDLDLVCGNAGQANTLYLNDKGTFASAPSWSSGPANDTYGVALGDVDGDGDLDLVCANGGTGGGANTLYLNDGGVFEPGPVWSSGPTNDTRHVALGDVDGDGDLDLVCGNNGQANTLYLNEGGVFALSPAWSSVARANTHGVALGDVDGDGALDLACANAGTNYLYRNAGGLFEPSPIWASAPSNPTRSVALGDVDGDGDLDLVCGNAWTLSGGGANTLYRNQGGRFELTPVWSSEPRNSTRSVALADIDGDGKFDLVCGNSRGQFIDLADANTVYGSMGAGFEATPIWSSGPTNSTRSVALGDIDGDGDLDLVCGNADQAKTLYLNDGGVFEPAPVWSSGPTNWTASVALGDVDGDGDLDLVCGNPQSASTLYLNDGGVFEPEPVWSSGPTNYTYSVALGDVDGDGDLDLVCGNLYESNTLYLNDGGVFEPGPVWSSVVKNRTVSVTLGDVDGDGDLDLVYGNYGESNTLYLNDGGVFDLGPVWSSGPTNQTLSVALGDVDGDGDLDLVFGNYQANTLYLNDGGVFDLGPVWSSGPTTSAGGVALGDVDGDGDLDLVCGNAGGDQANTLYRNVRSPVFKQDPLHPTHQLPNNSAYLRFVRVSSLGENLEHVGLTAIDVESDPVWVVPEYQHEGAPGWSPVEVSGQTGKIGPLASAPEGVEHTFVWDFSRTPFDSRTVVLRLRTISVPRRVSVIQHVDSYLHKVGALEPIRPEIAAVPGVLSFATMTVGDRDSLDLVVANRGTGALTVTGIELPSPEMRGDWPLPITIDTGEQSSVRVFLEPRQDTAIMGDIRILSNDPLTPIAAIEVVTDIRALEVETELLRQTEEIPLGEAVTVIVTPAPDVNVERGLLYHRPGGSIAFLDSIPLSTTRTGFVAVIPGEAVTESDLEYYVRIENGGVIATDPAGAPGDSVFAVSVSPPVTFVSQPVTTFENGFLEGRFINVQVDLPGGAIFRQGTLYYRQGAGSNYESTDVVEADPLPVAVIPDSIVGSRGVDYWIEVQTATRTLTDPPTDPGDSPHSIPVIVVNLVEERSHAGEAYRLLSVPLRMQGTFAGSVTDELGAPDPTRWRMFAYEPVAARYVELPNAKAGLTAFEQGQAYWLVSRDAHRIGTGDNLGETARTDRPFEITLQPGYNLVGSPFNFPVAWASFTVDAVDTLVQPPVGWVAGRGYVYDVPVFEPFDGYWVKNRSETPVVLSIPAVEALPGSAVAAERKPGNESNAKSTDASQRWRIQIGASSNGLSDQSAVVGIETGAARSWDRHDRSMPPMHPGEYVAVHFPHQDWGEDRGSYAHDLRGEYEIFGDTGAWGQAWRFDVAKSFSDGSGGDEIVLTFSGSGTVPEDAEIRLVDRHLDRLVDLREESRYEFYQGERPFVTKDGQARFVLLVGSEEFVELQAAPLTGVPTRTVLHQNVPNPFNPSTIVRYELSTSGPVSLRVYDVSGALVRVLENREREPGRYEIGWNGENDRGERVASGVYFYRLAASGFSQTKKMIVLK